MATQNTEILDKIDQLINSDEEVSLPGLELDPIVENFVDTKYGAELSQIEDEEERKALREKWIEYYRNGDGSEMMKLEIASIKTNFSAAKDQLTFVAEASASAVASNAVPAVITTGAAASAPNPAYALIENKTKKNQLLAMLKNIGACIVNLLKSALIIAFQVPAVVLALIDTLITTKSTVNAIPV